MATAIDTEEWSDKYNDAKCSICAKENKDKIAHYYCYDCKKHMCTSCIGTHNKFIENHNAVTLYCRQHDELLCRKCHLMDHRKCQEPKNIRESSDELNADLKVQLKTALAKINKAIKSLDQHVASIQQSGNVFLKDLEDYAKKLLSRIEELREKGKRDIKYNQKALLSVVNLHRQTCDITKDEIKQFLDKITNSKKWEANKFVLKKKGQTMVPKVDSLCNKSFSLIKGCQFNFMADVKIFDSLNCFNSLIEEGSIQVQAVSSQCAVGSEVDRPVWATLRRPVKEGDMPVVRPKTSVEKASDSKQVRQVNIRLPEDNSACDIYGCCHLGDGSLLICDYSNRKLKRVDPSSGRVTMHCDTDGQPRDLCSIGPYDVAVVFGSTQVHVYCAGYLTQTRTIELGHNTCKIACHGEHLYCGATSLLWSNNNMYKHDLSDGRLLGTFPVMYDNWDEEYYDVISGFAVNVPVDRLYVTGWGGLSCAHIQGQTLFSLSQEDLGLSRVSGVTTDHRGHIFVCGCVSNSVVKVTENGYVVGEILSWKDGIEHPRFLSYDVSRSQLCVGGKSDQILIVEVK